MSNTYLGTIGSFLLAAFVLLGGLNLCMAGGCGSGATEAGKSVTPAGVSESTGEKVVKPQSGPNPYTDDVIRMKKMQNSESPQPVSDTDGKEGEADKSE